jgi:hypothetical protein
MRADGYGLEWIFNPGQKKPAPYIVGLAAGGAAPMRSAIAAVEQVPHGCAAGGVEFRIGLRLLASAGVRG